MKLKFTFLFLFMISLSVNGQTVLWTKTTANKVSKNEKVNRNAQPKEFLLYSLNLQQLKNILEEAPLRGSSVGESSVVLPFPLPDGSFQNFLVIESPIMEPGLAEKFPQIKTYKAIGIDDPTATMRFSITQYGFHAMSLSGQRGSVFIDPFTTDGLEYIVYSKAAVDRIPGEFLCLTEDIELPSIEGNLASPMNDTDDQTLRTYRLALSCTAEYGNFFGTTPGSELADIQAQMTIAINRVNEIYERDLAITLVFVANNDQLVFFGNTNADPWNGEWNFTTQTTTDNIIGAANYDIGHNFNRTGGGNAGCISCVCINGQKGSGYTGLPNPVGDPFYIDYVAHEMGHQFGGFHTMNYCARSGDGTTEVEPGSGSSIMGYAGICPPNVQPNSDAHFNYVNVRDISANIQPGGNSDCGAQTSLNNQPPVADAGADYAIPKSTAFVLRGLASDPDGTASLTYNWSQNDPEEAPDGGTPDPMWAVGPLYRSILPTDSPNRYLPKLSDVLNGNLTPMWEATPAVARSMSFAFLVRDNGSGFPLGIGQTDADLMEVTVAGNAGPFTVTSQNSSTIWNVGESKTITWDVANTTSAPVNAANVDILLSTDGGLTFGTTLASDIPNDGSEQITVPSVGTTNNARIMVQASDNLFYAVNSTEFSIQESEFVMNFSDLEISICQPNDAIFEFTYQTFLGFSETTTFSATNAPAGTTVNFIPSTANADGTVVQMIISNTSAAAVGSYVIAVTGTSPSVTKTVDVTLNIHNDSVAAVILSTPTDAETGVGLTPVFTWEENANAATYDIEISGDSGFTTIVQSASVATPSYLSASSLNQATTYFWHVRAVNDCGIGDYSSTFSFTTTTCSNCASSGNMNYATSTTLVDFNTINNSSGKPSGYSDYTTISTTVHKTSTYDLTVQVNTDGPYSTKTMAWIDWNQNCSFDDAGETYNLGGAANVSNGPTANSPLSITVPANAIVGSTVMRVSTQYFSTPTSCETGFDGEVEDYTINVEDLGISDNSFENFTLWPNPNNGEFSVRFISNSNQQIEITVYDLRGRKVYAKNFNNPGQFDQLIKVKNLQSGLYLLKISDGKNEAIEKLMIQ
ncbi:MAG TPA: zinc-dependent metalloprotease family protein [Flavobacteriaceae bacterium]|nr:zinc-dependent metalloprotease family protein [Flavobacteriaceae bacterium]